MATRPEKDWQDRPSVATPIDAAALEDADTRGFQYAEDVVAEHAADTDSVHGIPDTSLLVVDADLAAYSPESIWGLDIPEPTASEDQMGFVYDDATGAFVWTAAGGSVDQSDIDTTVATHSSETTSVHGITDTSDLVLDDDSRLTDSRAPSGAAGGVLGGTYPDPSFAADMATQAELDAHGSDTTSVHGIADTSALATSSDLSGHSADTTGVHGITDTSALVDTTGLAAHNSDTTSVHGIADTADLVLDDDARLIDDRDPNPHSHPQSDVTDLETDLDGKQPVDTDLTAIAALSSAADKVPYATGAGTWALADFSAAGRELVNDADIAAQRTTLDVYDKNTVDSINAAFVVLLNNVAVHYKPVLTLPPVMRAASAGQLTRGAVNVATNPPAFFASGAANAYPLIFTADAATQNISGRTTKLKVKLVVSTNATAPGITWTAALIALSGSQGGSDSHNYSWGSTPVSSSTATVTTPAASTVSTPGFSSAFDLPSDGHYVIVVSSSGAMPADARLHVHAQLLMAHV